MLAGRRGQFRNTAIKWSAVINHIDAIIRDIKKLLEVRFCCLGNGDKVVGFFNGVFKRSKFGIGIKLSVTVTPEIMDSEQASFVLSRGHQMMVAVIEVHRAGKIL